MKGRLAMGIGPPDGPKADKSVDGKIPRRDPGPGRGRGGVQVKKGFRGEEVRHMVLSHKRERRGFR
ncbi:hypothetical protein P0O24_10535 [Methanotrichaceae archaeon M04Ac]|uniref:Uncharacterized protein n=1 Tax=Candidatus Methanocrinis alkalitolerans TaxID=3033395 RepID=A0ABT5XH76_9EURY|nr:hypothetical protein [Candidatus Methanocrinis alkalitolerans]MDF0594017.1 hypothetical protein [Candidatus Methanocrinis alkalitolerans]